MNSSIISISGLSKSYQGQQVLDSLDWQIEQGDIVALLGKNGAGKSTLLETMMSLREADSGEIKLWQSDWNSLPQSRREQVGFVAQDIKGFEWMQVKDFLSYLGGFFPGWNRSYCEQLQSRWNLNPKKRVGDLSGGQTQILHVIQALSIRPELLILDEPVAHLDPNMRRQFLAELIELSCELNSTVVFSSHIVSDMERIANKVALLLNGKIDYFYEVEQLKACVAQLKIASKKESEKSLDKLLAEVKAEQHLVNCQKHASGISAIAARPSELTIEQLASKTESNIEVSPLSLEDWYLEVSHAADVWEVTDEAN